jgi:hemerythrin
MWTHMMAVLHYKKPVAVQVFKERRNMELPKTSIAYIDEGHIEILNKILKLDKITNREEYFTNCIEVLNSLNNDLFEEEELMKEIHYPGLKIHQLDHESLHNFFKVFIKPLMFDKSDKDSIIRECVLGLRYHIQKHDVPLAEYINSSDVTIPGV